MSGTTASIPRPTSSTSWSAGCARRSIAGSRRSCCIPCEAWVMSSAGEREAPARAYGLRLGVWYATLFIAGSLTIVYLTYVLTSASLAQRDRQIIDSKLGTYAAAYDNGGIEGLASVVRAEQQTAPERLFVRVTDELGRQAVVVSQQEGWDLATLETGKIRLSDGTLIEVGKSTELRD